MFFILGIVVTWDREHVVDLNPFYLDGPVMPHHCNFLKVGHFYKYWPQPTSSTLSTGAFTGAGIYLGICASGQFS